jgi:hypothetical protein
MIGGSGLMKLVSEKYVLTGYQDERRMDRIKSYGSGFSCPSSPSLRHVSFTQVIEIMGRISI